MQRGTQDQASIRLPATVSAGQRAWLHAAAEAAGVAHATVTNSDGARVLTLGPGDAVAISLPDDSDDALRTAVLRHFPLLADVPMHAPPSLDVAVQRFHSLLEQEQHAEAEEVTITIPEQCAQIHQQWISQSERALQSDSTRGGGLRAMRVSDMQTGLLGRTLLTLVTSKAFHAHAPQPLPPHALTPHDVVALRAGGKGSGVPPPLAQGVVYRVRDDAIVVALDDPPEEDLELVLRIDRLGNEVTYKRYRAALSQLQRAPHHPLVRVAYGSSTPRRAPQPPAWTPINPGLDASQRAAVTHCLTAADLALVHGPPGTGKTTAVVEYVLQEAARGARVLLCAASNVAVDTVVERLAEQQPRLPLLRVGHPARLLPSVLSRCLEAVVQGTDSKGLARDAAREAARINARLLKLGRTDRAERRELRTTLRQLASEQRAREAAAVEEAIRAARVVAATLTGVGGKLLHGQAFDVVVVDEAAQAMEPACWAALLLGRKGVLAGDHQQLPPTVVSREAAEGGLADTLFGRLRAAWPDASVMLTTQYRMHADVMGWASQAMYDSRLQAHASVAGHTLRDLPVLLFSHNYGASYTAIITQHAASLSGEDAAVLLLVDTAGCDMEEVEESGSRANAGEAAVVAALVERLLARGLRPSEVGVITPYSAQVALLRGLRRDTWKEVDISTVDGFQGREKEAIIISMVRSNAAGEVGFLSDKRRINVAVTRARRQCTLVCDSETVRRDRFLAGLLDYVEAHGEYASAQEYVV